MIGGATPSHPFKSESIPLLKMAAKEASLEAVIESSNALIKQLENAVRSVDFMQEQNPDPPQQPNALALAASAAMLLKAQTTKLSLLALNQPFTPTEMSRLIRSLTTECFPALVTAVQLARPRLYSRFLHDLLRVRISDTLGLLPHFFNQLPRTPVAAQEAVSRHDTLQYTGQIWESCDFLIDLAKPENGLGQAAANDVMKWKELINDAVAELKEWQEHGADILDDGLSEGSNGSADVAEKLERTRLSTDSADPSRSAASESARLELATEAVDLLKLIKMLYPPLMKRRVRKFPLLVGQTKPESFPMSGALDRLDNILCFAKRATELTDSVAEALYIDDADAVKMELQELTSIARQCIDCASQDWHSKNDEFTVWSRQWLTRLDELPFSRRLAGKHGSRPESM